MVQLKETSKERLDSLISQAVSSGTLPGIAYGATDLDGEIYFGSAGNREIGSQSSNTIDKDSVFRICSQTKIIATIAGLQLVDSGKISLDTPVADIIPELANPLVIDDPASPSPSYSPAKNVMKFSHLLDHSSGLWYDSMKAENPTNLPSLYVTPHPVTKPVTQFYEMLKAGLPSVPLEFEPGTDFAYGYSSDTIGFIVERVSGKTLEEYCAEHIFGPLGMTKTTFLPTAEVKKNLIELGWKSSDGTIVKWANQMKLFEENPEEIRLHFGGVGLYSTVKDFLSFLRHLLQVEAGRATNPIVSKESVDLLFKPSLPSKGVETLLGLGIPPGSQWSKGLCINLDDWPGMRRKHSGWWAGWANTYFMVDPTTGIAVMLGTQIIPPQDLRILGLNAELEKALYSSFGSERSLPATR